MRPAPHLAGVCAAALYAGACLPDSSWKERGPTVPEPLDDGWVIATPESVGLDPDVLASIHDELLREDRHFGTLGFLVIKDGRLVFETYLRDAGDRDRIHHIQSATKSVTSLAFGIAWDEGLFATLDTPIVDLLRADVFTGLDPRKRAITLEHVLTMRSGIAFENDVFSIEMLVDRPADPLRYILEKPLAADPGQQYVYKDADPQLLAYVIEARLGRTEESFVEERLLAPLGITEHYWEALPDGTTFGGAALHLRPRDFAKIGQLVLDCVAGRSEIVSAEWCEAATREHVRPEDTLGTRVRRGAGYYFWTLPDYDAFAAWGHGGQYLLIVPSEELVLVQIALPDSDYLHGGWLADFVALTEPVLHSTDAVVSP